MADLKTKIMQLDPATPVDTDWFPFVKVSDTTQSPQGSTVRGLKSELQGATGNGISSVTLISTAGLVKTYRITFTDAPTFDFEVTDGTDGADGADGTDGTNGTNGTNGTDGADGRSIVSVTRTSGDGSPGTTDTYTITYDKAPLTSTFDVYNGADGTGGGGDVESVNGQTGVVTLDTGDISEVTDKNYVTDAEKVVIGNTSNTNTGDETSATINAKGAVMESDYSPAHSLLVQQSGTGNPSSVSVGNNEILGRQTGGGANIEGLSATQVRSVINVEDGAEVNEVTLAGVETLTNKTLTDPKINLGSDATGDLYYRNASGEFERLPIGAAGQVLTESSGIPSWADASGGGGVMNFRYPHDYTGSFEAINNSTTSYTVPTGKVLYITQLTLSANATSSLDVGGVKLFEFTNNVSIDSFLTLGLPMIIGESETVTGSNGALHGFLCDENSSIEPVYSSASYTVPTGKVYVILGVYKSSTTSTVQVDGVSSFYQKFSDADLDLSMNVLHEPIFLNAGEVFNGASLGNVAHFGYLVPDDFSI